MARSRIALVAVAALTLATACTASERTVQLPDGRRMFLHCEGSGAPTVILDAGAMASSAAWGKVLPEVAKTTRVCAYDRAGYGRSDPGPLPRDGRAVAEDLDQLLRAAGIDGPFVLAGHSAGALYVRMFSDLRPSDVAGMVLIDPSVERQDRRFAAAFGPGAGGMEPLRARAAKCLQAAE